MPRAATKIADAEALAARLRARDPRAERQAWAEWAPLVLRFLRRFCAAGPDCEDLRQEVFLRFFARIHELRNPAAVRHFLLGICVGVGQNERRRLRLRRAVEPRPPDELPDLCAADPNPEARELAGRLLAVLARSNAADRALFLRRRAEQMEMRELAAAERTSLSTLRRRLAVASRRIHARLRADPGLRPYVDGAGTRRLASG